MRLVARQVLLRRPGGGEFRFRFPRGDGMSGAATWGAGISAPEIRGRGPAGRARRAAASRRRSLALLLVFVCGASAAGAALGLLKQPNPGDQAANFAFTTAAALETARRADERARRAEAELAAARLRIEALSAGEQELSDFREAEGIGVSLAVIMPLGFLLGFAFPIGMRLVEAVDRQPTPWFWGVNGATGVLASVLGVVLSMSLGINVTLLISAACYLLLIPTSLALLGLGRGLRWRTAHSAAHAYGRS